MWDNEEYEEEDDIDCTKLRFSNDPRHQLKLRLPPDVHLPNKNEAKLLRKLMAETGLNEEEIRSIYKYRKMLSAASKKQGTKSEMDRKLLAILKEITREVKLPKKHPIVLERFKTELMNIKEGKGKYVHSHYRKFQGLHMMMYSNNDIMRNLGLV